VGRRDKFISTQKKVIENHQKTIMNQQASIDSLRKLIRNLNGQVTKAQMASDVASSKVEELTVTATSTKSSKTDAYNLIIKLQKEAIASNAGKAEAEARVVELQKSLKYEAVINLGNLVDAEAVGERKIAEAEKEFRRVIDAAESRASAAESRASAAESRAAEAESRAAEAPRVNMNLMKAAATQAATQTATLMTAEIAKFRAELQDRLLAPEAPLPPTDGKKSKRVTTSNDKAVLRRSTRKRTRR